MGDAKKGLAMHRILYIDSSEGIFGGGQISLLELLEHMNKAKYQPLVVVSEEGRLKKEIRNLGIECRIFTMPSLKKVKPFLFFSWFWRIFNYARNNKIKLIHSNTSRATLYAAPVAKILRIPLIWHVRIPHTDNLMDKILVPFCSQIITVSRTVKRRFNGFKKNRVEVIYNGVNKEKFSPGSASNDMRRKFRINSENMIIGTVGRLSPEKGLEYLISAIRSLVKVYPQTKVLIVGNGDNKYRRFLQEKVDDLKLSHHFIFTGFFEDIPQILRCMDIFCLPSMTEGFNRSILEAMACQLPVVATAVGGNIEIVQDRVNGLLVPPRNPEALLSAIRELLNDRERARKMGLEGRRLVEEKFSIEKNVMRTEEIYERIISGK